MEKAIPIDSAYAGPIQNTGQMEFESTEIINAIREEEMHPSYKHDEITRLKVQYNILQSKLDLSRSPLSPLSDPLQILPHELWEEIIYDSANRIYTKGSKLSVESIMIYSLVSSEWQRAICSTPKFWTDILISSEVDELADKLHMALYLSKDYPLSIFLDADAADLWIQVGHLIIQQSRRIRSIHIANSTIRTKTFERILPTFESLPNLEFLSVWQSMGERPDWNGFLGKIGYLRSLKGMYAYKDDLQLEPFKKVRSLEVPLISSEYVSILQDLEHLEELVILRDLAENRGAGVVDALPSSEPLCWKILRFLADYSVALVDSILNRSALTLVVLEIRPSWPSLSNTMTICQRMQTLQDLTLHIDYHEATHDVKFIFSPNFAIRRLTLHTTSLEVPESNFAYVDQFIGQLGALTPNVQYLSVQITTRMDSFFHLAANLTDLVRFETWVEDDFAAPTDIIRLSAETLLFSGTEKQLRQLEIPRVSKLSIEHPFYSIICISHCMTSHSWSSVSDFTIEGYDINWNGFTLPNLRKIRINARGIGCHLAPLSSFCEELALYPHTCPQLRAVESDLYPEWDILFLMLERRNCSTLNAERISKVSFPCIPPPIILRPLFLLLQGRFPIKMNYFDYSLSALSEQYFDSQITGCVRCHLSFHFCKAPNSSSFPAHTAREVSLSKLIDYPNVPEEILSTRAGRLKNWNVVDRQKKFVRIVACPRHDQSGLQEITPLTLFGADLNAIDPR